MGSLKSGSPETSAMLFGYIGRPGMQTRHGESVRRRTGIRRQGGLRNHSRELGAKGSEGERRDHKTTGLQVHGLNPIRGLGGGAGRAGGSMMSMTRCKIVTMTAS